MLDDIRTGGEKAYHPNPNRNQWNPQKKKWKKNFEGVNRRENDTPELPAMLYDV